MTYKGATLYYDEYAELAQMLDSVEHQISRELTADDLNSNDCIAAVISSDDHVAAMKSEDADYIRSFAKQTLKQLITLATFECDLGHRFSRQLVGDRPKNSR